MTETRICKNCQRPYPLDDFPIYHAKGAVGHRRVCSKCKYFQDLAWIDRHKAAHRRKRAAYMREYRKTHPRPGSRRQERLERALRKR